MPLRKILGTSQISQNKTASADRRVSPSKRERQVAEAEIAGYIAQMSAEMAGMAQTSNLDLLAYFLSLARMEAETITQRAILQERRAQSY